MKNKWTHRKLCEDLAITKDTIFIEVAMGSKWMTRPPPPVADVVLVRPSYTRFCVDIFEIKVSRADFLSDIRTEKWKSYLPHCHRFYYAVLSNITCPEEIPDGCGLMVRGEKGWRVLCRSETRDVEVPHPTLLSLLFYREKPPHNINRRNRLEYYWGTYRHLLKARGHAIARLIQIHHYEFCKLVKEET